MYSGDWMDNPIHVYKHTNQPTTKLSQLLTLPTNRIRPPTWHDADNSVVALFGKGELVDSVFDETLLEEVAGELTGLPAVSETLHVAMEPVDQVGT